MDEKLQAILNQYEERTRQRLRTLAEVFSSTVEVMMMDRANLVGTLAALHLAPREPPTPIAAATEPDKLKGG